MRNLVLVFCPIWAKWTNIETMTTQFMNETLLDLQFLNEQQAKDFNGGYIVDQIAGYGCWCNFNNPDKIHGGLPVNDIDQICKNLFYNYQCISHDAELKKEFCQPSKTIYEPIKFDIDLDGDELEMKY